VISHPISFHIAMLSPMTLSATERVILVTGSTDGIGLETATTLARDPKHLVVVHGRNPAKAAAAVKLIQSKTGNPRVEAISADFSDLRAVRGMAAEVEQRFPTLHTLVCNAGVLLPVRGTTVDGYETTMGTTQPQIFVGFRRRRRQQSVAIPQAVATHAACKLNTFKCHPDRWWFGVCVHSGESFEPLPVGVSVDGAAEGERYRGEQSAARGGVWTSSSSLTPALVVATNEFPAHPPGLPSTT
jgi:hypothetical protein